MQKKFCLKIFIFVLMCFCLCAGGCAINFKQNINTMETVDMTPRLISLADNLQTSQVVENVKSAIVGIKSANVDSYSVGSGVAIREGGYILTNQHVISGARSITIYFADKSSASASLIWQDSSVDLAVIKSSKDMPYLQCETQNIAVGQDVLAIGTPLSLAFGHTVTKGIVSALDRTLEIPTTGGGFTYMQNLIQHDASINPGNSGGPLINSSGKVIGINTLKANDAEGIGFAIPIITGYGIVERLSADNGYSAPYMGVMGISTDYARAKNMEANFNGLYILDVDNNSVAGLVGVKKGDIIYQIDNVKINNFLDLRKFIYSRSIGDKVTVYLNRSGKDMTLEMTLSER